MTDQQQLADVIDISDAAVRSASQLRLFRKRGKVGDQEAVQKLIMFLDAAIGGGTFVSTGDIRALQSSLEPLNWVADIQLTIPTTTKRTGGTSKKTEYENLTDFLKSVKATLEDANRGHLKNDDERFDPTIDFLGKLGQSLGTRADQEMRQYSRELAD